MKKLSALLFALVVIFSITSFASADTGFDPSVYSNEELEQIMASISSYRCNAQEGDEIYNRNGIRIEYRGIKHSSGYVVVLFVENNTNDTIRIELEKALLDRAALTRSNAGSCPIEANTIWISTTGSSHFILYTDVLSDYGITHGTNLDCTFEIENSNYRTIDTFDLHLTVDMTP